MSLGPQVHVVRYPPRGAGTLGIGPAGAEVTPPPKLTLFATPPRGAGVLGIGPAGA